MRVLVTGGAGYIGSVVTEVLLERGHNVVVYDSLAKGHRDAVVAPARLVAGDVLDEPRLCAAMREHGTEAVVHMAALSEVGASVADPAAYYRVNVQGGLALLEAARACDVAYVVFSSTAAVYGEPATQPIGEAAPTQPTNPYGRTKLAFEHALQSYGRAYGLRYVSLRYFNAAGATARNGERHDPETHLIPNVLRAAAGTLGEVTVFGQDYPTPDGTCVRDYVHVLDLARAHVLALDAMAAGAVEQAVFNLGCGGDGYSVRQVIEVAQSVTGRTIPVRVGPRRPGDPPVLVASSDRIVSALGWRADLQDLRAIVASAWAWMQRASPREVAR